MWNYSDKLMDHFMNPRNSGQLPDPDGHSEVGSPQCGDAMTLDINVDDEDRISEIRFMTFGCAGAIAAASALTELARGCTIKEAVSIENRSIVEYLGGMPEEKYHCSVMGHEALSLAVEDFMKRRDKTAEQVRETIHRLENEGVLEPGSVEIEHVHPSRVRIRIPGGSEEKLKASVEENLNEITGRSMEVLVNE